MKEINEGNRVKIISDDMHEYRKKEIGQYIDRIGVVTNVNREYQAETMYSVMFSLTPFIQELFFEHEVSLNCRNIK